jgi:malate dehydrogenase
MTAVAILGAGELGGTLAHTLARRDLVRTIRLIDAAGQVARGKALDIMQAAPVEGFSTQVSGSTDVSTAAGSAIVILADRAAPGTGIAAEWQGDEALQLLKLLARMNGGRPVVCAGAAQLSLVERGVTEAGFSRRHLFGSAPEALASAVRAVVALEANQSPKDIALAVIGVPPAHAVVPWADATIGGFAATRMLDEPARRRIAARVAPLWPPGPYTLASAAADVVAAMTGRSRRVLSCVVAPQEDDGRRTRAAALPVRLDETGVKNVELPTLDGNARVALDNALLL